ncbi:SusD/RagB family nutrient-binding outer membrane lipoprotein [Paraflavisolibacter sp. H34]|uniref:SusD/RagB family nutrient-binding outer membrane lipoprotein n=1 Tax=Huijunlia imazamoxiresistens TaxID=3127457 RepID=UPI003015E0F6
MLRRLKYILPALFVLAACKKDFLEINTDPNNPTKIEVSKLLTTVEKGVGDVLAIGGSGDNGGLSQVLGVYTHQMSTREEPDQYGATGSEFYISLAWPKIYASGLSTSTTPEYGVLQNLEDIISNATEAGNTRYAGIAKVLKAYTYSQLVDVFGDVPFSEANKLRQGIRNPKFDDDKEIYPKLFALLDSGIKDLSNTTAPNVQKPGADDLIYGGDTAKWKRAANTIKLKLYTQVRRVQNVTAEVTALVNSGSLISKTSESFMLPYGTNAATDDRNPGFGDYYATQRSNHISPWFYEILKGYNQKIFTGIRDPRVPYYIYNQLGKTQSPRTISPDQTEYRDSGFVSIYFGSVGPDRDRNQQNNISLYGIYPVGGKYDDGSGTIADANSGTGAAPYRFITYADRLYLEAELINAGVLAGDAAAKTRAAIEESFRQVDYVITQFVKPNQTVPELFPGSSAGTSGGTARADVAKYINDVMALYTAGSAARKLEIIMTEKWISSFGSHVDQYTDYRRTGYPILFNPADPTQAPGGKVTPPLNGNPDLPGPQESVPVQQSKSFPYSLPWYTGELETNANAPSQKNPSEASAKVFWMP